MTSSNDEQPQPDASVRATLDAMGLESNELRAAVLAGYEESSRITPNDVATRAGYIEWATPLRYLGDTYVPRGFKRARPGGFEVLRSPDDAFDVAVTRGNFTTGLEDGMPSTYTTRGPLTGQAIRGNRNQLRLDSNVLSFDRRRVDPVAGPGHWTWLLLHYRDEMLEEIRVELSIPVEFDGSEVEGRRGTVTHFEPRLILPSISVSDAGADIHNNEDEGDDEIDISISRR